MTPFRRRMLLVGALLVTGAVVATLSVRGLEKNLVYYLDPAELLAKGAAGRGATVRLGGLVQAHTLDWKPETLALRFRVGLQAEGGPSVMVQASGAPPQMFQEGIGAVVEGQYDGQVFRAERVMVKHSNEYRPPAEGERPQDLLGTLQAPLREPALAPAGAAPPAQATGPGGTTRYE